MNIRTSLLILTLSLNSCLSIDWGHHFWFENKTEQDIDSLKIIIGDKVNWIYSNSEYENSLEGNLEVPKKGYPHKVEIEIFSNTKSILLPADSFNCFNCDGSHEYILNIDFAEYKFYN